MIAASGSSATASQATASRASATDNLTVRQSAILPPMPDQQPHKSALALATDASLQSSPFSFHADAARLPSPANNCTVSNSAAAAWGSQAAIGSPLPTTDYTASSPAAAAADGTAAGGTQAAQTVREPKLATASERSDAEGRWEVVPGAEHLKQLKDAKARWLASGATCTVKR